MVLAQDTLFSAIQWRRRDRQLPTWRGVQCHQFPADLWRYGELCFQLKPPFIVEVGVAHGGTALFLADLLRLLGNGGVVVAIDINPIPVTHPQLDPLIGDSLSEPVLSQLGRIARGRRGLVLLDGDHRAAHVAGELDAYAPLATYLVVEDTIMGWLPEWSDGPHKALDAWLPHHPEFMADPDPIPGPTQHPGGWLRRVGG